MFEENENLVEEETTENTEEQTEEENVQEESNTGSTEDAAESTEENVEDSVESERLYTEEEFNKKLDEVLAKKIALKTNKIRKEYEKKYGRAETIIKAGMQKDSFEDAVNELENYYIQEGVNIPQTQEYSSKDTEILAKGDADEIINSGYDDVVEEVDRLAKVGIENMTLREKLTFQNLAEYRKKIEKQKELESIGVKEEIYNSENFKKFAKLFNSKTPMSTVYEYYTKTLDQPQVEKMGSMKNKNSNEEKTYYSPDDVDKLTSKDLDDPKIFARVHESMKKWK